MAGQSGRPRCKYDFANDVNSATGRTGAFAEVPWCDPFAFDPALRHRESGVSDDAGESVESTHRRAIEMLCIDNGWTVEVDGDVRGAFEAEKVS